MFYILKEYFEEEEYYTDLLNTFHEAQLFRAFGKGLERKTDLATEMNYLNLSRHEAIVKYQVSYFSYYFPLALAMNLAGIRDEKVFQDVKNICFKVGYFYQVIQDRKNYTKDIRNATPSWFLFQALKKATRSQKLVIKECYHSNADENEVEQILQLYQHMNLENLYNSFIVEQRDEITEDIKDLVMSHNQLTHRLFTDLMNTIVSQI